MSKLSKLIIIFLFGLNIFVPCIVQADEVKNHSFTADKNYWDENDSTRTFYLVVHYRVYYADAEDRTISITVNMCEEDGIFVDDWLEPITKEFNHYNDSGGTKDLYIGLNGVFTNPSDAQPFTWQADLALNDEAAGFPGQDDQEFRTYIHIDDNGWEETHDDERAEELIIGYRSLVENVPNYSQEEEFLYDNDCGQTALTNILAYWDDHPDSDPYDRLVDDGSGTDKEKLLWLYEQLSRATTVDENGYLIYENLTDLGITIDRASDLVDFVCNKSFFGNTYNFQSQIYTEAGNDYPQFTWDIVKQEIDSGRPFLISIEGDSAPNPNYNGHMVVCVGYYETISTRYLILHDGSGEEAEIDFDQYLESPGITLNALAILPGGYTADVPPQPPAQCSYTKAANSIEITWEPSPTSDVTNYRIYKRKQGYLVPYKLIESTEELFFEDTDVVLEEHIVYEYLVTAVDRSNYESGPVTALTTYTISGYVKTSDGTGVEDVVMQGLPNNTSTQTDGSYSITVDNGWSGTVTPTKAGFNFYPPSEVYTNVTSNQTQDYTATLGSTIHVPGDYDTISRNRCSFSWRYIVGR